MIGKKVGRVSQKTEIDGLVTALGEISMLSIVWQMNFAIHWRESS